MLGTLGNYLKETGPIMIRFKGSPTSTYNGVIVAEYGNLLAGYGNITAYPNQGSYFVI